jgi:hypothetical protein
MDEVKSQSIEYANDHNLNVTGSGSYVSTNAAPANCGMLDVTGNTSVAALCCGFYGQ